jgi:hypothetical protein
MPEPTNRLRRDVDAQLTTLLTSLLAPVNVDDLDEARERLRQALSSAWSQGWQAGWDEGAHYVGKIENPYHRLESE